MLCLLWLALLGVAIWGKASQSTQLPIYDAIEYYRKANTVWNAVSLGQPFNPFNVHPTLRPPGTVLMSYPFGFSCDYPPFYFRSVFFPAVLVALAAYLAVLPLGEWAALMAAVFLSAVPFFYHFEFPDELGGVGFWGLVDAFFGAVAALSIACALHSARRRSRSWLVLGASLAAFCLLIKPAGIVIMVLFAAVWLWLSTERLRGIVVMALLYGVTCLACFGSYYLSYYQIDWESRIISNMRQMRVGMPGEQWGNIPHLLLSRLHASVGDGLSLALALTMLLGCMKPRRLQELGLFRAGRCLLAAVAVLAMGLFFCFGLDGWQEFRYIVVFVLMSTVLCLPLTVALVNSMSPPARWLLAVLALLPPLGLVVVLLQPQPNQQLQRLLGTAVTVGRTRDAEAAIYRLTRQAEDRENLPTLFSLAYFMSMDGVFESASQIDGDFGEVPFIISRDRNMFLPYAICLQEMMTADYILFPPMLNEPFRQKVLKTPFVADYQDEELLLAAWLTGCGPQEGVSTFADMAGARLLQVTEPTLFEKGLQSFIDRYRWRPLFYQQNPPHWLTEAEAQRPPKGIEQFPDVIMGKEIRIRAVEVEAKPNMLQVTVLWQRLRNSAHKYTLYLEAKAKSFRFVSQAGINMSVAQPPDATHTIRQDTVFLSVPSGVIATDLLLLVTGGRGSITLVPNKRFMDKHCLLHLRP